MKKLLFIFNPYSGKAQIKNKLLEIVDIMVKAGYEVTIYPTQARADALNLVQKRAKKYDLVVCSGGDGTLDEAVSGMMLSEKKVPLGYIPAGSTNDFANSLKIPKDMVKAAKAAVSGKKFACDVGKFNDSFFIYVAAFGIFTAVSYKTSQEWKNILGHAAYILEGAKSLHEITSYHMRVEYEDQVIEDEFIYGMITNSNSVGGFKNMTGKNVLLDDGKFEVTLIRKPKNLVELNEILASLSNMIDDTDAIYSFKSDCITFYAEEKVPWTLDGEYGGNPQEVKISNQQQALEIMVKK
ncbi:YegS/Rv2252/BmrU family lipid kinase [Roseburia sp. BX1005]|uniref:YegS/Rv2252/BmrU family lipid kinase n=1 Tax=Roseburia zhanii TaxID=2763064 RepID=A0A923LLK9_9FIRM|nr:YegS/Rv2252/BmrU family lipid kinase [Roseburia zhanii]MBC5713105.1 YegS/Rv2252/BmrU family lipid kinase [Roseburia zhanii]